MYCRLMIALLAAGTSVALARPSYVPIPVEDYQLLQAVMPVVRMARANNMVIDEIEITDAQPSQQQESYASPDAPFRESYGALDAQYQKSFAAPDAMGSASGYEESHYKESLPSNHVDYGAYTGKHGAFGWYSDHPVFIQTHRGGYH